MNCKFVYIELGVGGKTNAVAYMLELTQSIEALFGGGYRSGAVNIMKSLLDKYGESSERI
jgi:hypothetical protein